MEEEEVEEEEEEVEEVEEEEVEEEEGGVLVRGDTIATDCRGASSPHKPSRMRPWGRGEGWVGLSW